MVIVTSGLVSSILRDMKITIVNLWEDMCILFDKVVDYLPFLIKYDDGDDGGKTKISLSPSAQMVLYVLSTIYSTQPLFCERTTASSKGG